VKTRERILEAVKNGKESQCLDGRDFSRIIEFFPVEDWQTFGFSLKDGGEHKAIDLTKENVLEQLKRDVEFGFEKALNQRSISASFMYEVVKMWMWVLDDDLESFNRYAQYGLPLFKAVAIKHGFENQIGEDTGDERKYASGA